MSISAQAMSDYCMAKLIEYAQGQYKNEMDNPKNTKVLALAMKEYLEENLEVTYSWAGSNSDSSDPTTSYVGIVEFTNFDIDTPMSLEGMAQQIMDSVATGVISAPAGFSLSPGDFTIKPLVLPTGTSYETAMMECVFTPVCAWIVTCKPGSPMSGTHGGFSGTGTMVNIS